MKNAVTALYHPVSLNREYLAEKILDRYKKNHAKIWNDFSLEQRAFTREEYLAVLESLEESLATGNPAFLLDHACRERSYFAAGKFPPEFVVSFLEIFKEVLLQELPEDYRKNAGAFAGKTISYLKSGTAGTCTHSEASIPLSPEARAFLTAVLAGDQARAGEVVNKALAEGMPVPGIYTTIFQPVLHEMGRLWQQGEATVAEEHYVTAVVLQIMEQMHDRVAKIGMKGRRGKTVVAACVGEELHGVGIRMVADFFKMDGWNVYNTGANTPAKSILSAVKEQNAAVVALSITMPSNLSDLQYLVRSLRADEATAPVKIIVGGLPFSILPELWKQVGADAAAAGVEEAVAAANRLTG
jgi:methanogenic corrinoid protein MtbC1